MRISESLSRLLYIHQKHDTLLGMTVTSTLDDLHPKRASDEPVPLVMYDNLVINIVSFLRSTLI